MKVLEYEMVAYFMKNLDLKRQFFSRLTKFQKFMLKELI